MSTLKKYLDRINEQISDFPDNPNRFFIFRGHSNEDWSVKSHSSRVLHIKEDESGYPLKKHLRLLKKHDIKLVNDAKMKGHHLRGNGSRELRDLEILADLRHYNTPTSLIDFTSNFLIALWFACGGYDNNSHDNKENNTPDSKENNPSSEKNKNGKVFIVDAGEPDYFLKIDHKAVKSKTIDDLFSDNPDKNMSIDSADSFKDRLLLRGKYWYWIPENLNDRVRDQDCVFIFGRPFLHQDLYKDITVDHGDKENLLKELEELFDYTVESLFYDKHGWSIYYKNLERETADVENPKHIAKKIKYHYRLGMDYLAIDDREQAQTHFKDLLEDHEQNKSKGIPHKDQKEDHEQNKILSDVCYRLAKIFEKKEKEAKDKKQENKAQEDKIQENKIQENTYKIIDICMMEKQKYIDKGLEFNPNHIELQQMKARSR